MKGKHKALAERRQVVNTEYARITMLQNEVLDMGKTITHLRSEIDRANDLHKDQVARLNKTIEDNTSNRVQELEHALNTYRERLDKAKIENDNIRERWDQVIDNLVEYIKKVEKTTGLVAMERIAKLIGAPEDMVIDIHGAPSTKKLSALDIKRIQKARGER